ncbi:MAG: ABC transporter permease, partial [Eubacterium sp.]|nr:ABC transporter permease [Eubacterium sp.]
MLKRLIINDFKANKIITISTSAFMAVTAMLLGLAILLFARLYTSIDSLMKKAETPSFLQMHTGELDEEKLNDFTRARSDVEKMQVCNFLNLQNSQISIGGRSFEGNMQDNGLCCQSESFDYLLDADGAVIEVLPGEVYVPVCYKNEYDIKISDEMRIGTETLTVAGFLRDSQMNSMMASSKRFLVCESDYERIRSLGSEEYLIEFRLKDGSDVNAFATAYKDSGLPDNGPTITYPLIKTMNALSDGIMILVILLVSVVVLFISILCIRYIILTQMEKDRREIGMLKAVGISRKDIRNLYMSKYLILSAIGCLVGIVTALFIAKPLGEGMRELYGEAENAALVYILMFIGAILAEVIILLSVRRTLRKTEKESAVSALCGRDGSGKKKNLWVSVMIVVAAAAFMIIVPQSMKTTLGNPEFVTYMGIGNSQIRMDVRQTEDIDKVTENLAAEIEQDERVDSYSVMQTGSYKVMLENRNSYNLMIECGDHGRFPVNYIKGSYPKSENDIALSILNAEDMGLDVG